MLRMRPIVGWVCAVLVLVMSALLAEGCNTFKGLGQDIEHGGKKLQEATGK